MHTNKFYTFVLLSISIILVSPLTELYAAKRSKKSKPENVYFLTKLAAGAVVTAATTSFITKTKRQKLWHIPIGITTLIWMCYRQKKDQNKCEEKYFDENAPKKHATITFFWFYGAGIVAVEGTRGIKSLVSYYFHRK